MHPIVTVIEVGARQVPLTSYGICLTLALVVAAVGTLRAAFDTESDLGACIALFGLALGAGLCGAVALHVAVQSVRLGSLLAGLEHPGLASFGAGLCAASAVALAAPRLHIAPLALLDRACPTLCVAQAIGRVGCLLGGCCYGRAIQGPFALVATLGRHPVPLYEATALLLLAALLSRAGRSRLPGVRTWQAIVAYCALRIGLEFLRGDAVRGVIPVGALSPGLSIAQLIATGVLLVAAMQWRQATLLPARSV